MGGGSLKRVILWVGLLVLTGWSAWRFSQPDVVPQSHASLVAPDISKVAVIELMPASGIRIRLKEKDGTWLLAGSPDVPANRESVSHLLDNLADMRVIRVVTHTHAHDDTLGMNKGVKLVLRDQADTAFFHLTVGKQGSDLISTYVRVGRSPEVLAVNKSLAWQVTRSPNAWKAPPSKPGDASGAARKTSQGGGKLLPPENL